MGGDVGVSRGARGVEGEGALGGERGVGGEGGENDGSGCCCQRMVRGECALSAEYCAGMARVLGSPRSPQRFEARPPSSKGGELRRLVIGVSSRPS